MYLESAEESSKSILASADQLLHKTPCNHNRLGLSAVEGDFDRPSRLRLNANYNPAISVPFDHQGQTRNTFVRIVGS